MFTPGDRAAARARAGPGSADCRCSLFVGRIQPLKGARRPDPGRRASWRRESPEVAAAAARRRPRRRQRHRATHHPEGPRELAISLGIGDQVDFLPPVDRPTLAQWYRAADLVVVPSRSESFGLVAIEALACGTPVVAADVGGLPVAVGAGGVLVQGHDPGVWAAVLAELLTDPARRERLGRAGKTHAQNFGWEATVDKLLDVYTRAVSDPSPIVMPEPTETFGQAVAVQP
ncbi:glycosyltransferase [Nostocoides sp.]